MSRQSATGIGAWVAARFSVLVPDWMRAMFLGYPLARPVVFTPADTSTGRRSLPLEMLISETPLRTTRKRQRRIDVIAPAELFLRRTVKIPKSARSKLLTSAELDLRQNTPFTPAQVHWQLDPSQADDGYVQATQWVVKKADVDKWRSRLATQGYMVRRVLVQGSTSAQAIADFSSELAPWRRTVTLLNGGLALVAVAAALGGWLYPAWIASQQTSALQAQVRTLQVQAVDLRREVEVMRGADRERTAFLDTILRRPLLIDTLREITVALPDDVWIASMIYTPSRVVMNGETDQSAADLVLKLGGRRGLGNPRLSGPVQRTATNAEKFEITVDLGGRD